MMFSAFLPVLFAGVLAVALWLAFERRRLCARHDEAVAAAEAARHGEAGALRLLRLTALELRGIGMRLHGHAGHLQAASPLPPHVTDGGPCGSDGPMACVTTPPGAAGPGAAAPDPATPGAAALAGLQAGLAAAAAELLDIADTLQDRGVPTEAPPLLREEVVDLAAEAVEAATQAQILLGPGLRNWRLPQPAPATWLWADRRAVRHVLGRVLADAVRNTGHQDWIEISLRPHPDGLELVVEDEGIGISALATARLTEVREGDAQTAGAGAAEPGTGTAAETGLGASVAVADSRGIGLRLSLARSLMQAHGGRLEVEAMARVGSRVCLVFPLARRRETRALDALTG